MRLHTLPNRVKVTRDDLRIFAYFQTSQRLFGLASEVTKNTYDEGQFFNFNGASDFHVVRNLHSGRADAIQFVLCTCSSHSLPSFRDYPALSSSNTPLRALEL